MKREKLTNSSDGLTNTNTNFTFSNSSDVQVTAAIGSVAIMVVVKGDVAFGSDPKQQFTQNFV